MQPRDNDDQGAADATADPDGVGAADVGAEGGVTEGGVTEGGVTDGVVPDGSSLDSETDSGWVSLSVQVRAPLDDGDEMIVDGTMNLGRGHVSLGTDNARPVIVGLRFTGVDLPPNAQIDSAHIQFQAADDLDSVETTDLTLQVEAADDAAPFAVVDGNLSARKRSSIVHWTAVPPWNSGERTSSQRSPDLSPLIRGVVARPGWREGQAIVFLIEGIGRRKASSYEKAFAPKLEVRWR